jgi:hypothetical protein
LSFGKRRRQYMKGKFCTGVIILFLIPTVVLINSASRVDATVGLTYHYIDVSIEDSSLMMGTGYNVVRNEWAGPLNYSWTVDDQTYAFRGHNGNVLVCNDETELEAAWDFTIASG